MEEMLSNFNNKDIEYVNEGEEIISNKPCLYTDRIYSCVALYAIGEDDCYLGHLLVEDINLEFSFGESRKVQNLYDFIAGSPDKVYVGMAYGVARDDYLQDQYDSIEYSFENIVERLKDEGQDIEVLETLETEYLIIDNKSKELSYEYGDYDLSESWPKK